MSYSLRNYRHRNPKMGEEKKTTASPFFQNSAEPSIQTKKQEPFFQPKLSVNQPGDAHEREADSVADRVVNQSGHEAPAVQKKEITGIQRLSTSKEDERFSTNDSREERDKEVPLKSLQRMHNTGGMEEKKDVQMMASPDKEKDKMMPGTIQRKPSGNHTAPPSLSSRIENSSGKGNALSPKTLSQMNHSFGFDLSHVRIHDDANAAAMNKELNAQAFTHGRDIYFDHGKYNPETSAGKFLLAHELTHVLQQGDMNENMAQRTCKDNANEDHYKFAANYCADSASTGMLHQGQRCYREIPNRSSYFDCPPGDQVCFDADGNCHDSWDEASPVEGKDDDGTCNLSAYCSLHHTYKDKVIQTWWDIYMNPIFEQMGKQQMDCTEICMQQPWYMQGFCLQGCNGGVM